MRFTASDTEYHSCLGCIGCRVNKMAETGHRVFILECVMSMPILAPDYDPYSLDQGLKHHVNISPREDNDLTSQIPTMLYG